MGKYRKLINSLFAEGKFKEASHEALVKADARSLKPLAIALLKHKDPNVREECAHILNEKGGEAVRTIPYLIEALLDETLYVRQDALWAIGNVSGLQPGALECWLNIINTDPGRKLHRRVSEWYRLNKKYISRYFLGGPARSVTGCTYSGPKAYLFFMKFSKMQEGPFCIKEFIVYGRSDDEIEKKYIEIFSMYKDKFMKSYQYCSTGGLLPVKAFINRDLSKTPINWEEIEKKVQGQEIERQRNRGRSTILVTEECPDVETFKLALHQAIINNLHSQSATGEAGEFIFICSRYDRKKIERTGDVIIVEGSDLDHASNVCELFFIKKQPLSMLIEWCCPVYNCDHNSVN